MTHTLVKYHEERKNLIAIMGGCCEKCGDTLNLEFHHIDHTGETKVGGWQQLYLIRQAMADNNIMLLCRRCHREHHNRYGFDLQYQRAYQKEHDVIGRNKHYQIEREKELIYKNEKRS